MSIPAEYTAEQDQGVAAIQNADGSDVIVHYPKRRIIVTHMEVERQGNRGGKPWTLFKLFATDSGGTPISLNMRTFDHLELGPVDVTMDAYVKNGGVQHYTVKAVKPVKKPQSKALVEGQCAGCAALEVRVAKLESRINAALRGLED